MAANPYVIERLAELYVPPPPKTKPTAEERWRARRKAKAQRARRLVRAVRQAAAARAAQRLMRALHPPKIDPVEIERIAEANLMAREVVAPKPPRQQLQDDAVLGYCREVRALITILGIARCLRMRPENVEYRVRRLEAAGVLRRSGLMDGPRRPVPVYEVVE